MDQKIFYDKEYDCLIISQKAENEKVKRNFMFDDVIISLTRSGKVVAIEIRDASKYLKGMGFNPEILNDMQSAKLVVLPRKDFIFIGFQIFGKNSGVEQKIPVANIPMACIN